VLRGLSERKRAEFYRTQLGTTRTVLWETVDQYLISGFTENYVRVEKPLRSARPGEIETVVLESMTPRTTIEARDVYQLPVVPSV
jgi:threonylcarbamoyladenosine tRNA methylthiotransferase MtaB